MPFSTDLNALESIIDPPSTMKRVTQVVAGGTPQVVRSDQPPPSQAGSFVASIAGGQAGGGAISDAWNTLASGMSAAMGTQPTKIGGPTDEVWWRKADPVYTTNEIYLDVVEKADMVMNEDGAVISGGIVGDIQVNAKLSGAQPEVTVSLRDPKLLDNASFHPCVKLPKFDRDNILSFVPPDGQFSLVNYFQFVDASSQIKLPLHFQSFVNHYADHGTVEVNASPRLSRHLKTPWKDVVKIGQN